ncbi:MAG: S1C family serine protease [Planctomycetales bacterium]|nr:S1C family serine protease [Planctomycetales bacterium]
MNFMFGKNHKKRHRADLCLAAFVIVICQGCGLVKNASPETELYNNLLPACVEILADGQIAGSGAFVSADGYVLTAGHCITRPDIPLEVLSTAHGRRPAALVAVDKGHDLALLKIQTSRDLPFLTVSKQSPRAGDTIYVVGSPLYRHGLLLRGLIASSNPDYEYLTEAQIRYYVQVRYITTMTQRGLSGGNWVNGRGEIIGVQSGWIDEKVAEAEGKTNSGIAFLAPQEAIYRLVTTKEHADTPAIGGIVEELWTQSPDFQKRFEKGAEGLVIHRVEPNGSLEKAGLAHEDLIVAADGKKVRYRKEFLDVVCGKKIGGKLEIDFIKPDNKGFGKCTVILDGLEQNWLKQNRNGPE